MCLDVFSHPFRERHRGVEHRAGKEQHELLAAVPADAIDLAHLVLEDRANCLSTASPAWCPYVSFTLLKRSRSHITQANGSFSRLRVLEHLRQALLEVPSIVEPREGVCL